MDGIVYQVELGPIFTCDNATMALIPIKHQLAVATAGDQITIDNNGPLAGNGQRHPPGFKRRPTRARQAILGRMNSASSALRREVGEKEIDRRLRRPRIDMFCKI